VFKVLRNAWAIPDLRKKILFTLFMIMIFRLGSHIPVPGLSATAMQNFINQGGQNGLFSLMDMFTGGAFSQATIFAMGITPYINSSIILQLLTVAIPSLEKMAKEGPEGRKKITSITRYLTIGLAMLQSIAICITLRNYGLVGASSFFNYAIIVISLTAGTTFIMWLGEQITDKGIGNGISLMIFAGIVSRLPSMVHTMYATFLGANVSLTKLAELALLIIMVFAMLTFVVFMNNAERRIPVQYSKRVVGRKTYGGQSTHIPIKVALAGVIPIIFASSITTFPSTIAALMGVNVSKGFWKWISMGSWLYAVVYFLLIIAFTFFYTQIQFNPIEMANNMKMNGGFIPGIRPGRPTSDYITKVLNKITIVGSLFLGIVAVVPMSFRQILPGMILGGTSLLIIEGVALETVRTLESQMMVRHYKGFLE
jgi:preprotein translocase, SecY subunit